MNRLQTHDLSLSIGNKLICRDLNLTIRAGEVWGVIGPNGSGKTTLLQALGGLHPVASGDIWLHEKPLKTLSIKTIAQYVGMLFQDFNSAFSTTVFEHCLSGRYPHQPYFGSRNQQQDYLIVEQALTAMQLLPLKAKSITHLSGGEKQRLAIATVLAQTPQIYLLDEPTNHLDLRHQLLTLHLFKQLAKTKANTVIMSLHDVNLATQYCDHVLLLFPAGKVLQGGVKDTLIATNLSSLYQYPIEEIVASDKRYFRPLYS